MIRFLLDTNIVSELSRLQPNRRLQERIARHQTACALPATVVEELQFGVSRIESGERRAMFQAWLDIQLDTFPVVVFDKDCAQWLGRERARLKSAGQTPPLPDALIAATAAANGLVLVTHNTADFKRFSGLSTQDWLKP